MFEMQSEGNKAEESKDKIINNIMQDFLCDSRAYLFLHIHTHYNIYLYINI